MFDLAVIGGGPGGYTAAAEAARQGLKVVLFEKDKLGGTCLNRGCMPTKALLHTAEAYEQMKNAAAMGLSAEAVGYDFAAIHGYKNKVVDTLRDGIAKLMKSGKVTVVEGKASIAGEGKILCGGETYEAADIIVATGSVPACPPIPGLDLPGICTSDEILEGEGRQFESLIIIGGGVIGVEIASVYNALGTKVTILEAMDRLLPPMDKEIAQRLSMYFKKRGIAVFASAKVKAVAEGGEGYTVTYEDKAGKEVSLTAQGVLVATGRRADISGLFGEGYAPETFRGAIAADEAGRTNLPHLYVIGDAKAYNIQLAHVAEAQAKNAVAAILNKPLPVDVNLVPSCVYTSPEIASVGLTETQAKEGNIPVKCTKYLSGANGKCLIEGAESGYIKLVAHADTGVLLGAQLVYPRATDLIGELALAVQKGLTAESVAAVIHPHPTFCEGILAAAEALE